MATTSGFVFNITWIAGAWTACFWVGPSMESAEIFYVVFDSSSSESQIAFKKSLLKLIVNAQESGYPVSITHSPNSAEAIGIAVGGFDICPIGEAIHGDFYSISGSSIAADAVMVFESALVTVTVTPNLVRPHWVLVYTLPSAIPAGRNMVRLRSSSGTTGAVPVNVSAAPRLTRRVLFPGQPKTSPYAILLVANPAIRTVTGTLVADPVLGDRPGFHDTAGFSLTSMITATEDLLRQGNIDSQFRLVTIFDTTAAVSDANALAQEVPSSNLMETRRDKLRGFLSKYFESADIVFVMYGSTTHDRATAWFTSDDSSKPGITYTYDGTNRTHGRFPSIPGSAAIPLNMDQTGLTPLHEFCHAASDFNAKVRDLYVDGSPAGFNVNKKFRALSTDAIPTTFAVYTGTTFASDRERDGLGYPSDWKSFHPVLIDATRPNVMDNFWLAFDDAQRCQLDSLTKAWLTDRIRAKLDR